MCSPAVFAILSIGHKKKKIIIIRMIAVGKYLCLKGYSYPHRVIILVVCTLKFLVDSPIRKLHQRSLCLSIWKSRGLLTKRKVEILAS